MSSPNVCVLMRKMPNWMHVPHTVWGAIPGMPAACTGYERLQILVDSMIRWPDVMPGNLRLYRQNMQDIAAHMLANCGAPVVYDYESAKEFEWIWPMDDDDWLLESVGEVMANISAEHYDVYRPASLCLRVHPGQVGLYDHPDRIPYASNYALSTQWLERQTEKFRSRILDVHGAVEEVTQGRVEGRIKQDDHYCSLYLSHVGSWTYATTVGHFLKPFSPQDFSIELPERLTRKWLFMDAFERLRDISINSPA